MEFDKYLIATAQISLAMAGFAGVVAAYRNQSENGWGLVERFWLRLLLFNSILPFVFSVAGIFILVADPIPGSEWRLSSGIAFLFLVTYAVMIVRNLILIGADRLKAAGSRLIVSRALFGILIAVCLLQLWNALFRSAFWPFLTAILALILGAAFQFARLVLTSHRPINDKSEFPEES